MTPIFVLNWLLVLIVTIGADICWARYTTEVGQKRRWRAASWSALIVVCGCVSIAEYLNDLRLMSAAVVGAFIGTAVAVR